MLIIWTEITNHCSVVVSISLTLKDKMFINPWQTYIYSMQREMDICIYLKLNKWLSHCLSKNNYKCHKWFHDV